MVLGVVLAEEKFFGYLSAAEADEHCAGSLGEGGATTSICCLGCEGIRSGANSNVVVFEVRWRVSLFSLSTTG
jgi:hypothetical protein